MVNSRPPSEEPLEETKFEWYVFQDEFEWRGWKVSSRLEVPYLFPTEGGVVARKYEPFRETELFNVFSKLDSPEAMVHFANRYGWLGLDTNYQFPQPGLHGELRTTWWRHIYEIRMILAIWDMIDDERGLREFIHWGGTRVEFNCRFHGYGIVGCKTRREAPRSEASRFDIIADNHFGREFSTWRPGETIRPAKFFVAKVVNRALDRQISSRLILEKDGSLKPYYRPTCLLAALWFQVYQHVTGRTKFRRCAICGERMDVTNHRSHKRVHDRCSHRLRMQRYRS